MVQEFQLIHRQFVSALERAVDALPENERVLYRLRVNAAMTTDQVAIAMQISRATAYRLQRSLYANLTINFERLGWPGHRIRDLFHHIDAMRAPHGIGTLHDRSD